MPLTHLGCPSCGGTLSLAEGQRVVSCRYCSAESLVLIPGAVPRYVVTLRVPREAARDIAQQFLRRPVLPQAVRQRGRIQDVSLCYVPFYEFTGTRLGTFFLRETVKPRLPVTETEEDGQEFHRWLMQAPTVKEDTRVIQQQFVRIRPACVLPELGVGHIRLEELRHGPSPVPLEPYDLVALQSRAVVFTPTKAPERFAEDSQRRIKVHGDRTAVVEQRLKILHYPVWQARYRHAGRPYEITVDGVTGSILAARSPVKIRRAAAVAVAALAVAALCFSRAARLLLRAGLDPGGASSLGVGTLGMLLGLPVGGAIALFLAWVSWVTFRRGGEMRLDGAEVEPIPGASVVPGGIEGIRASMAKWFLDRWPGSSGRG